MNKETVRSENIELSLPLNAAYVTAARLTASSIANRMGFDVDEIEDVKAAVSEACTLVIKKALTKDETFKIVFGIGDGKLKFRLTSKAKIDNRSLDDELGVLMIKSLMDNIEIICDEREPFEITMSKAHKDKFFE